MDDIVSMNFHTVDRPITLGAACMRTGGERLTFLRRRLGLTLTDAANTSGLSKSELSRLENGNRRLKDHHVEALARSYGMEADALRDLIAHMPTQPGSHGEQFLPCYQLETLAAKGMTQSPFRLARLPMTLGVSSSAYMIAVNDAENLPVPTRSIVVVDPAARTVLGDLIANVATWSPPLIILRRNEAGHLSTDNQTLTVSQFHKAVAVFSESHFAVE